MKGIILAGGSGTRLYPLTKGVSKQLMPVYDKPMIYYPLTTLIRAGIQEVAVITTPHDQASFQRLLGDGSQWGMKLEYIVQDSPEGLAHAFIIAEDFLGGDSACLVLGDNIYYGHGLGDLLVNARELVDTQTGAAVFAYYVNDPQRYGVVEFDDQKSVKSIVEKPSSPKSNYAVTGLYFYDNKVCDLAKTIKPSARGELEISCLNQLYLDQEKLNVELLGRGYAWLDTGTHDSMIEASRFVSTIEHRQGLKIGCPEECAFINKWIDEAQLLKLAEKYKKTHYGQYLLKLARGEL